MPDYTLDTYSVVLQLCGFRLKNEAKQCNIDVDVQKLSLQHITIMQLNYANEWKGWSIK